MEVIELRRPKALLIPEIQQLLRRATDRTHMVAPGGFDSIATDIFNFVNDDEQFMLLGAEGGQFKSVVLGYLPVGNMFPYPTVVLFYNEGSRELSKATQARLLDFIVSRGYTRMLAVNTSGHRDDVWLKGLTPEGAVSDIVGSLAEFEVA
jgi:hypothetical protein